VNLWSRFSCYGKPTSSGSTPPPRWSLKDGSVYSPPRCQSPWRRTQRVLHGCATREPIWFSIQGSLLRRAPGGPCTLPTLREHPSSAHGKTTWHGCSESGQPAGLSAGEPLAPRVDPPPPKRRKRGGDGDNALGRKRARSARSAPPVNNQRARVERIQRHWALAAATAASAGTSPASALTGTDLMDTYVRAGRATSGAPT